MNEYVRFANEIENIFVSLIGVLLILKASAMNNEERNERGIILRRPVCRPFVVKRFFPFAICPFFFCFSVRQTDNEIEYAFRFTTYVDF